jgi:hypothetical protein
MFYHLLLTTALAIGQESTVPPETPPPQPAPVPDRWPLMKSLQGTWPGWLLDSERMQFSGWLDMSYTFSSVDHNNLPLGFNYRANELLIQQNWIRFERTVVTSGTTSPSFGFRTDWILPGSDYRFLLARGIFDNQLTSDHGQPQLYGIDPIQFYAEAYFPTIAHGLDIKVGRFFAQFGVETNDAPSNALCSHGYTYIYDPFTHTGILTTTKLGDAWVVQAGMVMGCDVFINPADEPTFAGGFKWAPPSGRDSFQLGVIIGSGRFNQARNFHNPDILDLVWTHKFNARFSYNFETLYGFTSHVPDIGDANWLGVLHFFTWNFTPRLSGTTRLELFDDFQGQRTGFKGLYSALTAGLSFKPCKPITFRPEVRYDYNEESRPFEHHHGLFTVATDAIFRW